MQDTPQPQSLTTRAAWPLLVLTAVLQVYLGLSSVSYVFMGVPKPVSGLGGAAIVLFAGLQAVSAIAAFRPAGRRDLRGATLCVAASLLLGWLAMLPSVMAEGLDFQGADKVTPATAVLAPVIALASGGLAWRNRHPVAAALLVSAMAVLGILAVIVFAVVIAIHGF